LIRIDLIGRYLYAELSSMEIVRLHGERVRLKKTGMMLEYNDNDYYSDEYSILVYRNGRDVVFDIYLPHTTNDLYNGVHIEIRAEDSNTLKSILDAYYNAYCGSRTSDVPKSIKRLASMIKAYVVEHGSGRLVSVDAELICQAICSLVNEAGVEAATVVLWRLASAARRAGIL